MFDPNNYGSSSTISFCNFISKTSSDSHLWQRRPEHLSHKIHHSMFIQFPSISFHDNKDPCDAFQFSKQKEITSF